MTEITISAGLATTLILAFIGGVFAFGRIMLSQFEKRMDERAETQKELLEKLEVRITDRLTAQDTLREVRLKSIEENQLRDNLRLTTLTQDVHSLMQLLPMQYVRREDWIRFGAQIDHKLDRLGELFTHYTIKMRPPND